MGRGTLRDGGQVNMGNLQGEAESLERVKWVYRLPKKNLSHSGDNFFG